MRSYFFLNIKSGLFIIDLSYIFEQNQLSTEVISIKNLSYRYNQTTVLNFSNWELENDQHALILGNSGCGKTTLLHLLGGLLKTDNGEITIAGNEISTFSTSQVDQFRGKNIGFVFQKPHLIKALNVEENLVLAQYLAGIRKDRKRIAGILESLNMADKSKSKIYELSEGQAQRVSIARAVLNNPKLILADEPTSSLDDENCGKVISILIDQAKRNKACLIIATHDHRLKEKISCHIKL